MAMSQPNLRDSPHAHAVASSTFETPLQFLLSEPYYSPSKVYITYRCTWLAIGGNTYAFLFSVYAIAS